jgi:glycerophosphoryl diester phosphodiesterase
VRYWIEHEPALGAQAVYLDGRYDLPEFDYADPRTYERSMAQLSQMGVQIIAPPMWMLVGLNASNQIVPSVYTEEAKAAGLDIITWTLERSGPIASGGGWYFSDWPATVTYYANCVGL